MRIQSVKPLLVIPLLVGAALATSWSHVHVSCPVCDNKFKARQWGSTNNLDGLDRDLLEHAAGGQVFLFECWTCPRCCYTGLSDAFDGEAIPKDLVARLKSKSPLRPAERIDPKLSDTERIPAWVRWDLRIQILKLQKEVGPRKLALAHMRAAQTQRFEWDALDAVDRYEERYRRLKNRVKGSLPATGSAFDEKIAFARASESLDSSAEPDRNQRFFARAMAAVTYKSRGEDPDAARVVAALRGEKTLEPGISALLDDIEARIERERRYSEAALPYFRARLAVEDIEPEESSSTRYLLGLIHRKLGHPKEALGLLQPLLEDESVPDRFKDWIRDEIAKALR